MFRPRAFQERPQFRFLIAVLLLTFVACGCGKGTPKRASVSGNVPGIRAIGDVIAIPSRAHPQLAHVSSAEGIVAAERIAGQESRALNYDHTAPTETPTRKRGTR